MLEDDNDNIEEEKKPNRAERRAAEKELKKGRKPQRTSQLGGGERSTVRRQFSEPGQPPDKSRFDEVYGSGELAGYIGASVFKKELEELQEEQNAFVAWQAKQDEYVIYQNVDFDEEQGKDVWEPVTYSYYPLTVANRLNLQKLESELNGINRAIGAGGQPLVSLTNRLNKEASIEAGKEVFKTIDEWQYEKNVKLLQEQCAHYLRMDVDKEFEASNYADVTLALASARYAELHVPKSAKTRMLSASSKENKSAGIS